ncbi:MAG: hypothetical protein IJ153_10615 [Clostridia bacterium]|nr:hypothetical protein [Clostridia bacterium]
MSDPIRELAELQGRYQRSTAHLGDAKNDDINAAIRRLSGRGQGSNSRPASGKIHTGSSGGPARSAFDKALADKISQEMKEGKE